MNDLLNGPKCKSCGGSVRISEAEIRRLLEEMQLSESDMISETDYNSRLSICRACEHLEYNTTCSFCGCLVAIRAWIAEKHCPKPGFPKW
ncbi:MAG: DUF6171 family protein [Armatimonadetes bacterium]|nr:DUF6171 family protein [Armatimonadota bacterium]